MVPCGSDRTRSVGSIVRVLPGVLVMPSAVSLHARVKFSYIHCLGLGVVFKMGYDQMVGFQSNLVYTVVQG